jgi:hypothetical protein
MFHDQPLSARACIALPAATLFSPLAIDRVRKWNFRAEPFDQSDTLIRILTNLVSESIAECPDDEWHRASILKRMRLRIAG